MERNESTKILIFERTGYISSYMVKASTNLGYPTYVYSRPTSPNIDLLNEFHSSGVTIFKGAMDEHEKLVLVLKEVDIVISALACPQVLDQLKIIEAIKVAGNIKRFLPSDFGCEEDRVTMLPSFQEFLNKKKKIRRATEAEGIPYTFVSANCFRAYFVNYLLRPHDHEKEDITVYGSGEAKGTVLLIWYEGNEGEELQRQRNEGEEVQRTRNGADSAVLPLRKANQECNFVPQHNACITFLFIINLVLLAIYLFIQIVKAITVSCSSNSRCVPSCLALTGHA
ncbi:eugenol synthase 1-like [Coffea arabica]|uniref:Eugenol synthase 1-like n=1 Tax=Coffea arabica TaxID=13443 RepID=A0A6P6URV9_COFAR|nr:eugenol synthase 1-like [Coffea arabica]